MPTLSGSRLTSDSPKPFLLLFLYPPAAFVRCRNCGRVGRRAPGALFSLPLWLIGASIVFSVRISLRFNQGRAALASWLISFHPFGASFETDTTVGSKLMATLNPGVKN
jgi:hypothetical protein